MSKIWEPNKRQETFLSLPDTIFEALYGGAAGGGKSEALIMLPIVRKFYEYPRFKGILLRRTYPELERELIIRSQVDGYYSGTGATYNDQKKYWKWPSGARVQFGHMENEKDAKIYDTSEYNYIGWDEATSFTAFQYEYLTFSRCRSSDSNLPAFVRAGTNPGGASHAYFRKRFIEPCRNGEVIIREHLNIAGRNITTRLIFIPAKVKDNPSLTSADPGYIDRLYRLPEAERLAKAEGDWWSFTGQVFDDFRTQPLANEPSNAQHVCAKFPIPSYWPRILSIDWGFSALTVAGWYAINPSPNKQYPAKVYKYREYSIRKTKISEWAKDIATLSAGEELTDIVIDGSAFGKRGDEFTIAEQFEASSGLKVRPADKDRLGGKLLIQEYLRWKPLARFNPSDPFSQDTYWRLYERQGIDDAEKYKNLYNPQSVDKLLPALQIFEDCKGIINNLPLCTYSKDKPEDVDEFHNDTDDFYDEFRYGLKACQFYLDGGLDEFKRTQETTRICSRAEQLNTPSALTKFYIDMDNLDSQTIKATRGIRRYHKTLRHSNF